MLAIKITDSRVSPSGETEGGGTDPSGYPKNYLVLPGPASTVLPKNVDFVNFMQFFTILPIMSPTNRAELGNLY